MCSKALENKKKMAAQNFKRLCAVSLLGTVICVGVLAFSSCNRFKSDTKDQNELVEVGGAVLYRSEVEGMIPKGVLPKDSANMAGKIIENWVRQQVLLKKAKENTTDVDEYLTQKIERYKNSLIIYTYQNSVLNQYLDTVVTENEIEEYYNKNIAQFYLKSNIVKVRFVKINKNSKQAGRIKKELFANPLSESNMLKLSDLCKESAENYYLEEDQWLFFNDLLKEVPIQTYNQEDFLKNNRNIEIVSDNYIYYVVITDFKVRDMASPLKFETERIRQILLNHRKQLILTKLQSDLLKEAKKKKWINYN